ncbi:MAG: hypothetical protein D6732_01035 [Methanobacteriota archaeon]|nr:MAG: hypothetical protein D6732_01035 [Euryarchaeota archaeon]
MMNFDYEFEKIKSDRESGSLDLALAFLDLVRNSTPPKETILDRLSDLEATFPDMTIFSKIKAQIIQGIKNGNDIHSVFANLQNQLEHSIERLTTRVKHLVTPKDLILTFSNSRTLSSLLQSIKVKKVFVAHSLPGGEGEILYGILKKFQNTELIEDNQIEEVLSLDGVKVMISCDSVVPKIGFVNKVGTANLCALAQEKDVPVILVGGWLKETDLIAQNSQSPLLEWIPWFDNIVYVSDR